VERALAWSSVPMRASRRPARAEVVGSLLRPPALRQAIDAFYERGHSAVLTEEREKDRTALREVEDAAIREAVRRQINLGLDVVTDGEFRRWMFMNSFYDAVSGVRTGKTVTFRNERGEDVELAVHEIVEPLQQVGRPRVCPRSSGFGTLSASRHSFRPEAVPTTWATFGDGSPGRVADGICQRRSVKLLGRASVYLNAPKHLPSAPRREPR
jgi:hypothetical protein